MARKRVTIGRKSGDPVTTTVSDDDTAREYEDLTWDDSNDVQWVRVEDAE